MSEFKWVPEIFDKFKYCELEGRILPDGSYKGGDSKYCIYRNDTKSIDRFCDSWPEYLKPRGKKATKKYDAQRAKWESEQVELGIGCYAVVLLCESDEKYTYLKRDAFVEIIDLYESMGKCQVQDHSIDKFKKGNYSIPSSHLRPATPAEIEAHKDCLMPEFKKGDYVYHKDEKNDLTMRRIKSISEVCQSCDIEGVVIKGATCQRLLENLRHATTEEIEAHELSLKPSVEQLRIERDAAADSAIELLASYTDLNDSAPFSACKKYNEAKDAHLQAVGGEG